MNWHGPQKRSAPGGEIAGAAKLRLAPAYRFLPQAQLHRAVRQCVACGARVANRSLGGCSGRSALTGPVWCVNCADFACQLVLPFGGSAR
jgi:hypothetical protein